MTIIDTLAVHRLPRTATSSCASEKTGAAFLPLALALFIISPRSLSAPLNYFELGQHLSPIQFLLQGGTLYQDSVPLLGPLSYLLPFWLMRIFGDTVVVLQILFAAGWAGNFLLLSAIGRRVGIPTIWLSGALLLFCWLLDKSHIFACWGGFRFFPSFFCWFSMVRVGDRTAWRTLVVAGSCASAALLFSPEQGAVTVVASLLSIQIGAKRKAARSLAFLLGIGIGYATAFLLTHCDLRLAQSYLENLVDTQSRTYWLQPWHFQTRAIVYLSVIAVTLPIQILLLAKRTSRCSTFLSETSAAVTNFIFSFLSALLGLRSILGPQGAMSVAFAVWGLLGLGALHLRGEHRTRNQCQSIEKVATIVMLFVSTYLIWLGWNPTMIMRWNPAFTEQTGYRFTTVERLKYLPLKVTEAEAFETIVNDISEYTPPGEPILPYPDTGIFNFLSNTNPLDRFSLMEFAAPHLRWREELLTAIKAAAPCVAIQSRYPRLSLALGKQGALIPEVQEFIDQNYQPAITESQFVVAHLREARCSRTKADADQPGQAASGLPAS